MSIKNRELISFRALEDRYGGLHLAIYEDDNHNKLKHLFSGYEYDIGKLSEHIIALYDTDTDTHEWENDFDFVDLTDINHELVHEAIMLYDVLADEYGVYQSDFGDSGDVEFNCERLQQVGNIIYND